MTNTQGLADELAADIPAIVAGLTRTQREALLGGEKTVDGRVLLDFLPPHGLNAHLVTMYSYTRDKLTPLGLAAREHILATTPGSEGKEP